MTRILTRLGFLLAVASPAAAQVSATSTEVFFSQVYDYNYAKAKNDPNSIDRKLAAFIGAARQTLDVAAFEIHNDNVVEALIAAHKRGVKVRIVSDAQYRWASRVKSHQCPQYPILEAAGIPIVYDTKTSLMHNKFFIRDRRCVWTGSFNPVDTEAWMNHNNAIKICSPEVAANFTAEFEEMFTQKRFGADSPANTSKAPIPVGRTMTVETCFAPEDNCGRTIVDKILAARSRILIMAFSVTDFVPRGPEKLEVRRAMPTIRSAILSRKQAGVGVWAVMEHKKVNAPGSLVPEWLRHGIPVRADTNPGTLHSKVILLDGETAIIGSFNFSAEAENGNDENMVIVKNRTVAKAYEQEWRRIWDRGKEVPPPRTCDPGQPIDVNRATQTQLVTLPGMAWRGAQNIVAGRPYATLDELVSKKILTVNYFSSIKQCLTVGP